ncbi:MAG: 6-carboxytetrahydropterin synthase QueD [Nanoarchaeota archaeon]|nr:6-carboxytetrahydropterin synthase QueD [Nanoarchaeota archaeon]
MNITKVFNWHCAHRLVGHRGLCKNVHGHTYKLEVEIEGNPQIGGSSDGMIVDFSDLKSLVKKFIVDKFDHAFVYNSNSYTDKLIAKFLKTKIDQKLLALPFNTTAENMAQWIFKELTTQKKLTDKITVTKIRLWETDTAYAEKKNG